MRPELRGTTEVFDRRRCTSYSSHEHLVTPMVCEHCGCQMDSADQFCPGCGKQQKKSEAEPPIELMQLWEEPVASSKPAESAEPLLESNQVVAVAAPPPPKPKAPTPPPPAVVAGAPWVPPRPTFTPPVPAPPSGKATASLVCGILPLGLTSIAAIILGHLALSEIKKSGEQLGGKGRATAGLALGYILVLPSMFFLAALAIPSLMIWNGRGGEPANQSAAVSALRTVNAAEASYANLNPIAGYTCDLQKLRTAGAIDPAISSGQGSGYRFEVRGCLASSSGMIQLYQVTASPTQSGRGVRAFCTDQSGVVRYDPNGSAEECFATGSPVE